jgi:hypothetical protein
MSSRQPSPFINIDALLRASEAPSAPKSTATSAFSRIIQPYPPKQRKIIKDRCQRPKPTYNRNYNPHKTPPDNLPKGYILYIFREPLYDNRPTLVGRLPRQYTVAGPAKKARTL